MKLSLLMALVGAAATATASPETYYITFTGSGIIPTSGQFTYDSTSAVGSQFSSFTVNWNNTVFDLTTGANSPVQIGNCLSNPTSANSLDYRALMLSISVRD
jgi:hypothetical protein